MKITNKKELEEIFDECIFTAITIGNRYMLKKNDRIKKRKTLPKDVEWELALILFQRILKAKEIEIVYRDE